MTVSEVLIGMNYFGQVHVRFKGVPVCGGSVEHVIFLAGDLPVLSSFCSVDNRLVLKVAEK